MLHLKEFGNYPQIRSKILLFKLSLYKNTVTNVEKAVFHLIDMHKHDFVKTGEDVVRWLQVMDALQLRIDLTEPGIK
jgi:hypothetical protein